MAMRKIILDVDTGSDDAVAIMTAILSRELELLGVTTVHGNLPLPYTTDNTMRVMDFMKSQIPVYQGCPYPLVQDLTPGRRVNADEVKHDTIIDGKVVAVHEKELPLPPAVSGVQEEHAVPWLWRTLKYANEKITLIPVGAMTNIATVLRMDPRWRNISMKSSAWAAVSTCTTGPTARRRIFTMIPRRPKSC